MCPLSLQRSPRNSPSDGRDYRPEETLAGLLYARGGRNLDLSHTCSWWRAVHAELPEVIPGPSPMTGTAARTSCAGTGFRSNDIHLLLRDCGTGVVPAAPNPAGGRCVRKSARRWGLSGSIPRRRNSGGKQQRGEQYAVNEAARSDDHAIAVFEGEGGARAAPGSGAGRTAAGAGDRDGEFLDRMKAIR